MTSNITGRATYSHSGEQVAAAHSIAAQLAPLIHVAKVAGLDMLAYLLGMAKIETEHVMGNDGGSGLPLT